MCIVVLSFLLNCIWLVAYVDYTSNILWSTNGFIWASMHLQLISDAWVATLQRKPILCLSIKYRHSLFVSIQTLVSTCEECICVWAMVNDKNGHLAMNKAHINGVGHCHIIQCATLNYKSFLCIVSLSLPMSKVIFRQYPFVLVSMCWWSNCMFPFVTITIPGIVDVSNWNFFHGQIKQFLEVKVQYEGYPSCHNTQNTWIAIHGRFSSIVKHQPATKLLYFDSNFYEISHRSN